MKTNPVSWFEIPVTDLQRAVDFYQVVLGYEIAIHNMGDTEMGWFPMSEGTGSSGSLVKQESYTPSHQGSMVYFSCAEDLQKTLDKVVPAGGKILFSKQSIGEYGFVGHFEDTEGNRIGLHSSE